MMWTSVILIASNLASFLLLSSNNRVSSLYWTTGSKHYFLTSFSYLYHYFLCLVFLQNCYLLVSFFLSWLHRNPISHPNFSCLWGSKVLRHTCTPIFQANIMHFLEVRHSWDLVVDSLPVFFPFPPFTKGFSCKHPLGNCKSYLFFSPYILELALSCMT